MTTTDIQARTHAYIAENFLYMRPSFRLEADDSLLEHGIIDSMGVMELIVFVEEEFCIAVGDEEITEDNFGSVQAIANYVSVKRAGGGALTT